jgi:hypothetical protein
MFYSFLSIAYSEMNSNEKKRVKSFLLGKSNYETYVQNVHSTGKSPEGAAYSFLNRPPLSNFEGKEKRETNSA